MIENKYITKHKYEYEYNLGIFGQGCELWLYPELDFDKYGVDNIDLLIKQFKYYPAINQKFETEINEIIKNFFIKENTSLGKYKVLHNFIDLEKYYKSWHIDIGWIVSFDIDLNKPGLMDEKEANLIEELMDEIDKYISNFIHDYIWNNNWLDNYEYEVKNGTYCTCIQVFHSFITSSLSLDEFNSINETESLLIQNWHDKPDYKEIERQLLLNKLLKLYHRNEGNDYY
jgi:hypothetical protein